MMMSRNTAHTDALQGYKVAILIANGFDQNQMVPAQRALLEASANVRIVSVENGLVNGWVGNDWGHNFAVDVPLNTALAADFDCLVVCGGQRSLDKLNLTAHTKRFVSGFIATGKPAAFIGDGVRMLAQTENADGRTVISVDSVEVAMKQAAAQTVNKDVCYDDNIMSFVMNEDNQSAMVSDLMTFFNNVLMAGQDSKNAA